MIIVLVIGLWTFLRAVLFGAATIALEHVALRHQLAVLHRSGRRPRLSRWDRFLWMWLSRAWAGWVTYRSGSASEPCATTSSPSRSVRGSPAR